MNLNLSVVHTYKLKFAEKGMSNNEMYKMAFVSLYGIEIKKVKYLIKAPN